MSLGMDMTSSVTRADVIRVARDSGSLAASSPLHLGDDPQLSILVAAPIYSQRPLPASISERRETILGMAMAAIPISWLVQTSLRQFIRPDDGFVLGMVDVTNPDRPVPFVLPDSTDPLRVLPGSEVQRDNGPVSTTGEDGTHKKVMMMNVGNRLWRVIIRPSSDLIKSTHGSAPWVILVSLSAVAIATASLVMYIWLQLARSNTQRKRLNRSLHLLGKQSARHAKAKMKAIEMTKEQIVLTEEAQRARNTKAQFLANMSHEIRTPMNGVIGLLHVLDMATDIPSEHRVHIKLALTAAQHLLRILNDILDFSKAAEGKLLMEAEPFDLYHSIESVVQVTSCSESAQNVEITLVFGDGVPHWLVGDAGRLLQLIANLLNNAVKFSSPGKVVLEVSKAEYNLSDPIHPIHVYDRKHGGNSTAADTIPIDKARLLALMAEDDAESQGEDKGKNKGERQEIVELLFKVTDSGIGMKEDQIRRLFKPFEQADRSTTRRFGGTGLGLTISRTLTETMGGRIWAESEGMRKGSTFLVQIPMVVDPAEHPDTHTDGFPTHGVLTNARILVVNENRVSIQNIETILRRHGCAHITTALSSEAALAHYINAEVDGEAFDLLIIDSTMPPVDGVTLLWEMRSSAESKSNRGFQAPCIILSGIGERDVVARKLRKVQSSKRQYQDSLVTKPIAADLFMKQVISFLSNTASPATMVSDTHNSRSPSTVRRLVEGLRILRIAYLEDQYRLGSVVIRTYFSQCSVPTPRFFQSPTEILAAHTRTPFDLIFLSVCQGIDTQAVIKVMRELRAAAQRKLAQSLERKRDVANSPGPSRTAIPGMPPLAPERPSQAEMDTQHLPILALVVPAPEWEKDFPEAVDLPHFVLVEPVMFESVQAIVERCKQRLRGPDTQSPQFSPRISSSTHTEDKDIRRKSSYIPSSGDTDVDSEHDDLDSLDELMMRASDRMERRKNNPNNLERISGEMEVSDMSDLNVETHPSASLAVQSSAGSSELVEATTPNAGNGSAASPVDAGPPFDAEGNPVRCLIVDDMHVNRKILNTLFRKLYPGCETQEAEDGLHATQMASSTTYGIILMDITMPVMDGIEAATEIRATEAALGVTPACIIAVSATSVADQAPQCRRAGYDGYLEKPVTVPRLRAAITDALASYKKTRGTSSQANGVIAVDKEE
eukprot:TRINITY_DN1295_c0_g1_i1.p1 TRINITY_DN1295_c0_g1~~TRINITY_DN1295_c0_g1_i1.p1  ORF type:complete len:1289 (+),score=202.89 TRINITY_DN1295_c0_g1_i1:349-3867(+)